MVSQTPASLAAYLAILLVVVLQRLLELRLARRNAKRALAAGAVEVGAAHYPWMVTLHSGFLASCALEVWLLERPLMVPLTLVSAAALLAATALRYAAIGALRERWTTRVFEWPDRSLVATGPYRWLRHPNYLAVVLEIVALPLLHGAWVTALVFSLLNGWLLAVRLRIENRILEEAVE